MKHFSSLGSPQSPRQIFIGLWDSPGKQPASGTAAGHGGRHLDNQRIEIPQEDARSINTDTGHTNN
ncbi:hypothetical protein CQ010_07125 [Arthrobacter sp. MYb211]|uniref:hypothetical protein n=1 Tax=unclassified Arthrobacter TaxID=235627 RepID=UPI000CFE07C9|nr:MULTISPECIES: hypothetical protein [unclassified Arthrobacter]PRA03252.1 hypothetical protein CQ019_12470 [Arthrobacter sp. MYb229]PRA11857.1 hypothetical protein CQ015_07820 [Arthrobacter sp. MYb221]PRB49722.1 hypothetical protein CQ013_13950 [Arthrobacter sp. MYb216]PRC08212.1 hypothetical protein CQ010_07125 [Arthrobacter sp. MYb211]